MAGIFISYRERDSKGWALSLRDRLVDEFGEARVFLDKDTLKAGKWKDQIEQALGDCNIVLVVIGRGWLNAQDDEGRQRLMSEDDVHRREIALALARPDVTVIPVVVDGATMPKPDQLPQNIRDLIQQQSRAISDNAAHRKMDLDGLMADIRRVGRFEPKTVTTSTLTPTPPLVPSKNSGKVIAALCLLALIFFAAIAEEGMDRDTKVGGILFGAIALWLAVSGFKDIKAGLVKGRGRAIAAMGLSGLATLGMFGTLTLTEPAFTPNADSLGPSAAIVAPQPAPTYQPPPTQTPTAPPALAPSGKPAKPASRQKSAPVERIQTANFQGIWQDENDGSIFYAIRQENNLARLQEYNALGVLSFDAIGKPTGNELMIDHPMLVVNLALSDNGQQINGSVKQKANGFSKPMLLRKVNLDSLDSQFAELLRPLVE